MIVVVGGQARKVGKTAAVCDIITQTRSAQWCAVKVTSHTHAAPSKSQTDTARYLAAGAEEAVLLQGRPPFTLPSADNLILESNAILDQVDPDVFFFIVDPTRTEWKISALRHKLHPKAVFVKGGIGPEHVEMVRAHL